MQDLENAGFKLFTQMHRGQQKGWRKYYRADCRAAAFREAIWDHLCPSSTNPIFAGFIVWIWEKQTRKEIKYLECDQFRGFWDLDDIKKKMIKVKGNDAKTEVLQCVSINLAVFEGKVQEK